MTGQVQDALLATRPDVLAAYDSIVRQLMAGSGDPADFVPLLRSVMANYGDGDVDAACRDVVITDVDAGGVPAQYFKPASADTGRRIVFLHGGGWLAGTLAGYRALAATLATLGHVPVLLVDYALAPEHPYPAGLDDCERAFAWAWRNGPDGAGSAAHVALAGDSAGGNLAAALTVRLAEKEAPGPSALAIISGAVDVGPGFSGVYDPIGGGDAMAGLLHFYTDVPEPLADPQINPSIAADAVLVAFPPTIIQASSDETLLEPNVAFARRLIMARVRTQLSVYPLMPHIWHNFLGSLPEAREALDELARFLR